MKPVTRLRLAEVIAVRTREGRNQRAREVEVPGGQGILAETHFPSSPGRPASGRVDFRESRRTPKDRHRLKEARAKEANS